MTLADVLSNEKDAVSRQGAKGALEKLAASLEALDLGFAPDFVAHVKGLKEVPVFYGTLPPFPKKPDDPYSVAQASGDLPTHDAVTEYEDDMMFYVKDCAEFAKSLAKAVRGFPARA